VPSGWPKAVASLIAIALILSTSYVQELEQVQFQPKAVPDIGHFNVGRSSLRGMEHGGMGRVVPHGDPSLVHLETVSVVLPCAFEGGFAEKTVDAIIANTNSSRLNEILVVDDGSTPPLSSSWPDRFSKSVKPSIRILRHERTEGLISAKKTGGDAARSDVIVFFDCHISPRIGWEEAFLKQMKRAGDHRTVVVPTITSLDPDTWKEIPNGPSSKACFTLLSGDFTWLAASGRDVPLMSGGLLALSRKWWEETGGYDKHMVAWGGENIDQSLRAWLCGGRIEAAEGAYVAHMWRDPSKPQTMLRYPIPTRDVMRNKARAITAWFGEFRDKVFTFPEYEAFVSGEQSIGDMSNFDQLKSQLTCAPFSSYLNRFSYVYLDGGLIPTEVFQIQEESTGFCLERKAQAQMPHDTILVPCAGQDENRGPGTISELQLWHGANRDTEQDGHPCCSGLMNWNFFTCLDSQGLGARVRTFECAIGGNSPNQVFQITDDGKLLYRHGESRSGRLKGGCAAPEAPVSGHAAFTREESTTKVEAFRDPKMNDFRDPDGSTVPAALRLLTEKAGGACAVAAQASGGEADGPGWTMSFEKCNEKNSQEIFYLKPQHGGYQVSVGSRDSGMCLDSASGSRVLIYPCYGDDVHNMNQVWHIDNGHLVWRGGDGTLGVDFEASKAESKFEKEHVYLATCASKKGQRIRKHDAVQGGSFALRDEDTGRCLIKVGDGLSLGACSSATRFQEDGWQKSLRVEGNDECLDAGYEYKRPTFTRCNAQRTQRWKVDEQAGWIKVLHGWEDNGRRRFWERCLDSEPAEQVPVSVQPCQAVAERGVRWRRINSRVPPEAELWNKAKKPSADDPVLGGDAEPPE
jgi:glycosyltransferase involved in cell wall biosynthesis